MKRTAEDKFTDILIILAILTVIALKITGVITISWFWLLSPIWIAAIIGAALVIFIIISCLVTNWIKKIKRRKENERY